MDALENVLLDGAGQRVVVGEEEALGEIHHVEQAEAVVLQILQSSLPAAATSSSLFRESSDFSLLLEVGSILSGITSEF